MIYIICMSDESEIFLLTKSLTQVWDYQTKSCVQTLEGHTHNVSAVCFHPDLPIIITGSEDGTVRIWHSTTYRYCLIWYACSSHFCSNVITLLSGPFFKKKKRRINLSLLLSWLGQCSVDKLWIDDWSLPIYLLFLNIMTLPFLFHVTFGHFILFRLSFEGVHCFTWWIQLSVFDVYLRLFWIEDFPIGQ